MRSAAIVSEKLAQECWKGEDPLGRRIEMGYEEVPTFATGGSAHSRSAVPGSQSRR